MRNGMPRLARTVPTLARRPAVGGSGAGLADLLDRARLEVLPTPGTADRVAEHVAPGRMITVTASPSRGLEPTVVLSCELAGLGYDAVPHLAARMVGDAAELTEIVARLTEAGITRVFVPSGDAARAGDYPGAVALLSELSRLGSPFPHVGVTGYPESHASISDEATIQAMWDKRRHATEMVSNMSFDPQVVATWLSRVRDRGVALPLWVGVPGPLDTAKLLTIAGRIGVGDSTRFLLTHRRTALRLATPGGFSTERFLRRLAPTLLRSDAIVAGLHLFTFNQIAETETWRRRLVTDLREGSRPRHPRGGLRHPTA